MQLADFGWKTLDVGDSRPLLTVLATVDSSPLAHDAAYYEKLLFGQGPRSNGQSVNGYFHEVSNKRFSWTNAGIAPITLSKAEAALSLEDRFAVIKRKLVAQGFDYSRWDSNSDSATGDSELAMMVFDNQTTGSAARRGTNPDTLSFPGMQKKWSGGAVALGHQAATMTICHELLHMLGVGTEMYGASDLNQGYTAMCATIDPRPDLTTWFHLDPFHKMKLGWCEPQLVEGTRTGEITLTAPQAGAFSGSAIIFDPNDSSGKPFAILEYRSPKAANMYDRNVPEAGLAVWQVMLDEHKNSYAIPASTGNAGEMDWSINVMGPPTWTRGRGPLWGPNQTTPYLPGGLKCKFVTRNFAATDSQITVTLA